jgi:hypothetical protein
MPNQTPIGANTVLQAFITTTEGTLLSVFYRDSRSLVVFSDGVPSLRLILGDEVLPDDFELLTELCHVALEWAGLATDSEDIISITGLAVPLSAPEAHEVVNPCCVECSHQDNEAA